MAKIISRLYKALTWKARKRRLLYKIEHQRARLQDQYDNTDDLSEQKKIWSLGFELWRRKKIIQAIGR